MPSLEERQEGVGDGLPHQEEDGAYNDRSGNLPAVGI